MAICEWLLLDVQARDERMPLVGREQPGDHLDGGCFACAIVAQKSHDFSRLDIEMDVIHGGEIAKSFGEPFGFNQK